MTGTRSDFGPARSAAQPAYAAGDAGGARRGPSSERIAALSALVESITEQIDAIEGAARRGASQRAAPPVQPQRQSFAQLQPAEDFVRPEPLRELPPRQELPRQEQPPVETPRPEGDRLGEIEARLAAIAGQMAAAQAIPAPSPAPRVEPVRPEPPRAEAPPVFRSAIAEIAARQQAIDGESGRLAAVDSIAIEDAITALRSDIATLGRRIGTEAQRSEEMDKALRADFAARLETMPREGAGLFDELRQHLADIRQAIDASARETTLASIELGYGHVIERLDDIVRRVPERGRVEQLADEVGRLGGLIDRAQPFRSMEGELEDIRNAIASLAATRVDTAADRQIAELRQTIERLASIPHGTVDLAPIERELAAIRREVDGFAKGTDPVLMIRLEKQVAAIHGMLEAVASRGAIGGEAALSRLEERIDALSGRFDAIVELPSLQPAAATSAAAIAAIDGLRGEISGLREHIVEREPVRFDAIDQQMHALMQRLDAATRRDDNQTLAQLEAQVASLAEKFSGSAPGADALSKVEENLDRMQSILGDTRRETIEAARDAARSTLSEFAGQLSSYPDEALIRALREDLRNLQTAALHSDRQNHDTLEAVHDTLAKVVERITQLEADEHGLQLEPAPRRYAELPEDHRPLAPGSGKPDLSLRSEFFPAEEPRSDASARPGDRKADFIAAARRAAQAAQAETAKVGKAERKAALEESAEAESRPGPLARIGQVFRSRRRPIMLAIAAVVLALGAVQYGPSVGERIARLTGDAAIDPMPTASVPVKPARPAVASVPTAAPAAAAPTQTVDPSALAAKPNLVAPASDAALAFEPASAMASPMSAVPAVAVAPAPEPVPALNVALVKRDANAGDVVAAFELGKQYAEGLGVRQDVQLAAQWYARAAKGGLAIAQYRLGSLYERGEGVKRDPAEAEAWYRKASAQGNARAVHNLGVMISEGATGAPDYTAAAQLFVEAANLGVADSQYNLGVLYARGLGLGVDLMQSYKWFALAAAQGDTDAGKRRDEVANALKPAELASARAAVQAFTPRPQNAAANAEPVPKAEWMQTASTAAPLAGANLTDGKG
ncbi:SEL1-like repeat protein [Kaistia soli]|nr:SEL1-like repeat protein [Kaistia soli]